MTDLPCPLCFGTKSWILIMSGQVGKALYYNPLGVFLFVLAATSAVWFLVAMIFRLPASPVTRWSQSNGFWLAGLGILIANWIYSLARVLS